jgi:hypothetical protein
MLRPLLIAVALLGGAAHAAEPDGSDRSTRLAALRGEVESLHHELTLDKAALAARLQTLDLARTELEVQIRQEELALAQLRLQLDEEKATAAEGSVAHDELVPAIEAGAEALLASIDAGLPYRRIERRQAVTDLVDQLTAGTLPPAKAANRLWQTFEDELRLGRENAVDRQTIEVDGEELLVDVARLGLVALFYRTSSGDVGWAERTADGWTWRPAPDRDARGLVLQLFDDLEKQIRVGVFTLPDVLPTEVVR